MLLATLKSPAVASCHTPVAIAAAVSWLVTVVVVLTRFTVPTVMPSSTTFDWAMHSSDTPQPTAEATLEADLTVMAAAFATGIGGKIGRYPVSTEAAAPALTP